MKKIYKISNVILAAMLALCMLALVACGGNKDPGKTDGDTPPAEAVLMKIEVTHNPDKMDYISGELFDPTGMEVTATYSDSTTKIVPTSDLSWSPNEGLTRMDREIAISYEKKIVYLTGLTVTDREIEGMSYRFESEESEILDLNNKGYGCSYIRPVEEASQGYILDVRNNSSGGNTVDGGSGTYDKAVGFQFTFNSGDDVEARLFIRASLRTKIQETSPGASSKDIYVAYKKTFSSSTPTEAAMWLTYVNGENEDMDAVIYPYGTYDANGTRCFKEYQWHTIEFNIHLKKGANELRFAVNGKVNTGPIDYIEIISPSTLENTTNATKHVVAEDAGDWETVIAPTYNKIGWIGKKCENCGKVAAMEKIPMLSEENGYSLTETTPATATADGIGTYSITVHEKLFTFENALVPAKGERHVCRFEGEDATLTGKAQGGADIDCSTVFSGPYCKEWHNNSDASARNPGASNASKHTYINNMGVAGNKITFTLQSDKAATEIFRWGLAKPIRTDVSEIEINKVWLAKVNGTNIFDDSVKVGTAAARLTPTSEAYCDWILLTAKVELIAGVNTIEFTMQHDETAMGDETKGYACNFDYVELEGVADVTNESENTDLHQAGWRVTSKPTLEGAGKAVHYTRCGRCEYRFEYETVSGNASDGEVELPALNKTDYAYTQKTLDDGAIVGEYVYTTTDNTKFTFTVVEQEAPHICAHVCETCGLCTDAACLDNACASKCEGHVAPAPDLEPEPAA